MPASAATRRMVVEVGYDASDVRQGIPRTQNDIKGLGNSSNLAGSGVGFLKGAIGGLAAVISVQQIAQYAGEIGRMAEQADKTTLALNALSAGQATASINALTTSLNGSISRMEAARIASALFATGVADSAAEAAHFAEVAAALGSTVGTDVATSIEFLRLAIDNMSYDRLGELGLSADSVRVRVQALKEEGLSLGEAFKLATLAEAEERFRSLNEAGVEIGTSTDRLEAAWSDLSLVLGEQFAPAYQGASDALAGGLRFIEENITGLIELGGWVTYIANIGTIIPRTAIEGFIDLTTEIEKTIGSMEELTKQINSMAIETQSQITATDKSADAVYGFGVISALAAGEAQALATQANILAGELYGVVGGANAAGMALAAAFGASLPNLDAMRNKAGSPLFELERLGTPSGARNIFTQQAATFQAAQTAATRTARSGVSAADKAKREHERLARETAAAYEREYNRIGGFVDRALSFSGGVKQFDDLLDRTGVGRNENASDELIRRLEDVRDRALEGTRSPWITEFLGLDDANLEVTAARAERLIRDLQNESKYFELIPFDKFLEDVRELEAAEARRAAFRDKAINALGAGSTAAVDKALGIESQGADSGEALARNIVSTLESGIEAEQARFRIAGELGATYFETGFGGKLRGIVQRFLAEEINAMSQELAA